MKVVVDSGNGIPGASAPGILRAMGCEVIDLYQGGRRLPESPSGPEQAREPEDLKTASCTPPAPNSAWPSTATATAWVSSPRGGNIIWPDRQIMLLRARRAQRVPGAQIIYDVKCSQRLPVAIERGTAACR
jgi:phosphomannomutase